VAASTVIQRGMLLAGLYLKFAPEELADFPFEVVLRQLVQETPALPSAIECHHEARLFGRSPEACHSKTKRTMPTASHADLFADMLDLRFPDTTLRGDCTRILASHCSCVK
jgi:hypothetical protein